MSVVEIDEHDETVEGLYNKKPIDRILNQQELQDIKKTIKQQDVVLNNKLGVVNQDIQRTTELLTKYNEDYVKEHEQLEKLKSGQQVRLTGDEEKKIRDMTMNAVQEFMEPKPKQPDTMKTVRVHFYTGSSEEGAQTGMGGEGAGSRDANFQVQLDQKIKVLSTQAAKYWGLDPFKVFFLDRDGRVVPENMEVSDIILPPDAGSKPTHMIKGRDYILTLVRAETVITKEDPNEPKGEKWQDFMFNQEKLEEDLLRHRIERGDAAAQLQKIDASQIPSLYELINKGIEKKRKRQWDTRCRLFEVFVFMSVLILFHFLLTPEDTWTYNMRLIADSIDRDFVQFKPGECRNPNTATFRDITVPSEYYDWVYGPLQRSVLNNSDLEKRNLYVLAVHARKFKNITEVVGNICKPPSIAGDAASALTLAGSGLDEHNVSNCTGSSWDKGFCELGPNFRKANLTYCNDSVGTNTGLQLNKKNASCAMLNGTDGPINYCNDPVHGKVVKERCPVSCDWCPKMCKGSPPIIGNSSNAPPDNAPFVRMTGPFGNISESCNNTPPSGFGSPIFCPLNCNSSENLPISAMYVASSDFVCTHMGTWSTPKCLAPCKEFEEVTAAGNTIRCELTKSGGICPLTCTTSNLQAFSKSGDYMCKDGVWGSRPVGAAMNEYSEARATCLEWKRTNGTCTLNSTGVPPVSSLLLAKQKCEMSEQYGGLRCEALAMEGCHLDEKPFYTCLDSFKIMKVPTGATYSEFREFDPPVDCIWVNPFIDQSCSPNVTNARPDELGGACLQGSTVPHGKGCKPMCAESYIPVYKTGPNAGSPYVGNATCKWGNLTNPFSCQYVEPEVEECIDAAVVDCMNDRVRQIFLQAKAGNLLWPACRKPYEKFYLDLVETAYEPENAFSLVAGQVSSYAGGERIPINISFPQGFQTSIALIDPSWNDGELRAVMYIIYIYSPSMHGLFVYNFLIEYSVAGNMITTVKHILLDLRTPSSLEVLIYVLVIVLAFGVFTLELRRILRPEFEDEKEKCNIWTAIFLILPVEFVTSMALRTMRQGEDPTAAMNSLILDGAKGIIDDAGFSVLYMMNVYDYYWQMVNLICLLTLNLMFFRYLLTYFPQMLYLTQMVQKVVRPMATVIFFVGVAFGCLGVWFYSMYGQFAYEFRDPLATTMATAHFAQGGFRDWTELYWQYPHLWRVLVTVAFIVFSLILRNLPIAVLVSHRKEMCLRENYSYHPFWTGQPNVPDKNGLVTFNPARGGWRWDKKDPYVPKEDQKMQFEARTAK